MTCRIAPMQDGIVRTCFRPEKAGPYSLIVKLDPSHGASVSRPATLTQTVTCVAGPMDIAKSKIDRSDTSVVSGRTGTLTISCCDIFGNPTCNVPIIPLTLVRYTAYTHAPELLLFLGTAVKAPISLSDVLCVLRAVRAACCGGKMWRGYRWRQGS